MTGFPAKSRRLASLNLKRCPLCGTLNARMNSECFTCRWHGEFQDDPSAIEEGFWEMIDRCPDLAQVFEISSRRRRIGPLAWLWKALQFWNRKGIDFRA